MTLHVETNKITCIFISVWTWIEWDTPRRPVDFARRFHNTLLALRAYPSYTGSPSNRLRRPNSSTRDPAPAVQVSAVRDCGKPWRKFTYKDVTYRIMKRLFQVSAIRDKASGEVWSFQVLAKAWGKWGHQHFGISYTSYYTFHDAQ
jgi:hypothetical protein